MQCGLPLSGCLHQIQLYDKYCVDFDLGEMFLNFPLHKSIRPYAGVHMERLKRKLAEMEAKRIGGNPFASSLSPLEEEV